MHTLMPDIANHCQAHVQGELDWVGMSDIAMPFAIQDDKDYTHTVSARVQACVNLVDPKAKGIHMSRLYLALDELSNNATLTPGALENLLTTFIDTHSEISNAARVLFEFPLPLRRSSLISNKTGWKSYPISLLATKRKQMLSLELEVDIPYSSTCPCSAALSRQLIQQAFEQAFPSAVNLDKIKVLEWLGTTQGIVATPHSQRSIANIKVKLADNTSHFPITGLIDCAEKALKTPVQAAVKREDEQEFARLNGQNLMFCEDAARRLHSALSTHRQYLDFFIYVSHFESLHDHNAICLTSKDKNQSPDKAHE